MHFIQNEKSDDPDSPSFVPSIFPTGHVKVSPNAFGRFDRRRKREESKRDALSQAQREEEQIIEALAEAEEETDSCDEDDKLPIEDLCLSAATQTSKELWNGTMITILCVKEKNNYDLSLRRQFS